MKSSAVLPCLALPSLALLGLVAATPADAIPRTFVSGTGAGSACTRAAPCATFVAAHNATDVGGEINCLDSGAFGGLNITKSITIDCAGTVAVVDGIIGVNAPGATVRLRNLTLGTSFVGGTAVSFGAGAALFVEKCIVLHSSSGIQFGVASGTLSRLFVTDTSFLAQPNGAITVSINGASAHATIENVRIEKTGLDGVQAIAVTNAAAVHVRNSVIDRAGNGVSAVSFGGTASITVDRSSFRLGTTGARASGNSAFVVLGRSTVMSNGTGLAEANGGQIVSYQNNHLTGNSTDGAPTLAFTLH